MSDGKLLTAREPLQHARWAIARLEQVTDPNEFAVLWVATVALLRAVGHVLRNVDAQRDPTIAAVLGGLWPRWKADALFAEFIEEERNTVLKLYSLNYDAPTETSACSTAPVLKHPRYAASLNPSYLGEDPRDLAKDAVEWWEQRLAELEAQRG